MPNIYDPACGRSCPLADPRTAKEFFEAHGEMRANVKDIKDALPPLIGRVDDLEGERDTNKGRKLERTEKGAIFIGVIGGISGLVATVYNIFFHHT
jgi:hypothetical protein